jgi:hypothetical protein
MNCIFCTLLMAIKSQYPALKSKPTDKPIAAEPPRFLRRGGSAAMETVQK